MSPQITKHDGVLLLSCLLVVIISGAAMAGWFTGSDSLRAIRTGYIPMAPNTALLFLLLATLVGVRSVAPSRLLLATRVGAIIAMSLVVARLSAYITGVELRVEHWVFAFPSQRLGLAPVGKMAFFTAVSLFLLALAVWLMTSRRRWTNDLVKALSIVVTITGLIFSLGYFYGAPLLYGGRSIPMAFNTAICFFIFGGGLLVTSVGRDMVEGRVTGESLRKAHDELEQRVKERTLALRAKEEFLRAVVETSPHAIFVKDSKGRFTFVNKAVADAYGRSVDEIIGRTEADFNGHGEEVQRFLQDDQNVLETLTPTLIADEQLTNSQTGETRSYQTIKVPLQLPGSNEVQILGIATDITDRKRTETALENSELQLRQSQKLEAVGRLAGGIAHDFNNLLTVIRGYSELLMKTEISEQSHERLTEIYKAADRASALTRQLLAFSRKQVMKPKVLHLNALVEGTEKMLRRLIGEDVEVSTALSPNVSRISADPSQIEQVLINLVVNARDAMPEGGKITIETANVVLDEAYADLHLAVKAGSYVMLAVSDTGVGMDAETRKQIFEPFFTTKETGKGTGLGLSMVYGIVKQSGGNIWVYSEVGKGTTFKIYFPVAEPAAIAPVREATTVFATRATETILLVEDEEMVRNLTTSILAEKGYRVLAARNGDEAIEVANTHRGVIDVLITDVIMPRMNGKQVADVITRKHPKIPVLYMSGYTDEAIVHHGVLEQGINFIEKPFTSQALTTKVRRLLHPHEPHHRVDASPEELQLLHCS